MPLLPLIIQFFYFTVTFPISPSFFLSHRHFFYLTVTFSISPSPFLPHRHLFYLTVTFSTSSSRRHFSYLIVTASSYFIVTASSFLFQRHLFYFIVIFFTSSSFSLPHHYLGRGGLAGLIGGAVLVRQERLGEIKLQMKLQMGRMGQVGKMKRQIDQANGAGEE